MALVGQWDDELIAEAQAAYAQHRRTDMTIDLVARVQLDVQDVRPPLPFAALLDEHVVTIELPLLHEPGDRPDPTLDELIATAPERVRRALGDAINPDARFLAIEVRARQQCAWALHAG